MTSDFKAQGDKESGRTLALMLLRYAVEVIYLGQFPSFATGHPKGKRKSGIGVKRTGLATN